MIAAITPDLALDVTYERPELRPGHPHRVRAVHAVVLAPLAGCYDSAAYEGFRT